MVGPMKIYFRKIKSAFEKFTVFLWLKNRHMCGRYLEFNSLNFNTWFL